MIEALDHVQVAMPAGREREASAFYTGLLGLRELEKPTKLAARGGAWFALPDGRQLHLGVEEPFRPSRKAHPAFVVSYLDELAERLDAEGFAVRWDEELAPRRGSTGRTRSGTGWSSWSRSGVRGDIMVGVGIRFGGRGWAWRRSS